MQNTNHQELAQKYPNSIFIFIDIKTAIIIDKEFAWLKRYNWHIDSRGYPRVALYSKRKQAFYKYLHRSVLPDKKGFVADHINGNTLDNRKENLRHATLAQNRQNSKPSRGRKYKGVSWVERLTTPDKYVAIIRHKHLGTFDTPEEAALAYNEAAENLYGEFARLNIVSN